MTTSPATTVSFLADSMVGKLARWLRLLGHDVRYERYMEDDLLVAAAAEEGRVVLTRDRKLVERRACRCYILLQSENPEDQLVEVVRAFDLSLDKEHWMRRCLECNGRLERADPADVRGEVPPYVYAHHQHFARCAGCRRVYWRGTHVSGMLARLRKLVAAATASTPVTPRAPTHRAGLVGMMGLALAVSAVGGALGLPSDESAVRATCLECQDDRFADARSALLAELRRQGIRDERVLEAIASVPRHLFVPEEALDYAYANHPLPIGHGQTISQPYIVALMSELLQVGEGEKVLEIGTGSGYQAAVLAEMGCDVYTIEILEPLAEMAARNLERISADGVHARVGDGYLGWPEEAPFSRIIVTAAPEDIPERLIEQLETGGRMVVPVGPRYGNQVLMLLVKEDDGEVHVQRVLPVRFVPMVRQR